MDYAFACMSDDYTSDPLYAYWLDTVNKVATASTALASE